ncbi:cellulase family glycosylhydrolase [Mucilaginibacter sp. dw_454]|uniref:glycoside hydrolase family 5 protein n=1 Tax=Mucilaginibacter sp. dw_454 TaxID=2720079 RepID=UPI001BD49274|nr:cellulase family glycosylhydrolase [Mucilaginibacter sp. dw_454]
MLVTVVPYTIAKNNPNPSQERLLAFKRAKSLDNGISVSWLEQTWDKDILNDDKLTTADFELLKTLGFKSIRLPVAFRFFESKNISLETVFNRIDKVVKLCHLYGIKLVIDYHYGELNDNNYLTETPHIINSWLALTTRYSNQSADDLFFELYNEPPHMDPKTWKDAAFNIVTAIRKIDKKRTLIVGASNFNSIYELSRTERMADENIVYTVHFYEPFLFTHQGASWVGDQVATTGVPFPYSAENFPTMNAKTKGTWGETNYYQYRTDGNEQSMVDKLSIVKKWADKYDVPLICTEYGSYKKYADQDSRCRYTKAIRRSLKKLKMPGIMWEYDSDFSIFNGKPSLANLPDCMRDAIGYTGKN